MGNKFNNKGDVNIEKQINVSKNNGQINISNNKSTINSTQNIDDSLLNDIDMEKLNKDLNYLEIELVKNKLYMEAESIKNVIEAKEKAEKIRCLQNLEIKVLEISQKISLTIATPVIARLIGAEYE